MYLRLVYIFPNYFLVNEIIQSLSHSCHDQRLSFDVGYILNYDIRKFVTSIFFFFRSVFLLHFVIHEPTICEINTWLSRPALQRHIEK